MSATSPRSTKVEIVAELAQGFEGRPEQARLLLRAAAAAGADAAKFQLVYADELAAPDYEHYELFQSLEMADDVWADLANYATKLGIELHLDIFGTRSLQVAERIGATAIKLHPTDIANVGLLSDVAHSSLREVQLGAGGAHAGEIKRALDLLTGKQVGLLFGFQGYPTPLETNQIARVRYFADRIRETYPNVTVGFADHAPPESPLRFALAVAAVGAGARILEKHLTLGRIMKLEDHESALNPDEFAEFSEIVRQSAEALGEPSDAEDFGMSAAEQSYRGAIRRHVVAGRDLTRNSTLGPADLVLKRTSADDVITDLTLAYDRRLKRDVRENAPIRYTDIE
ncbi:MAG: N-acetylneuraminate synthase family protein [Gemmatimonadota bacterium]|nr:N-acetylneuraminate synthase family protein [Gemmatimonadota bacterium]